MNVIIMPAEVRDPDFALLVAALDAGQSLLYPEQGNHGLPIDELRQANARVWLARVGGRAVGCVCLYLGEHKQPEVKRLYVDPALRGNGIASALLARLEDWARHQGLPALYLETGIYQPDAVGLYEKQGFCRTGRFGGYQDDPLSIYMRKCVTSS